MSYIKQTHKNGTVLRAEQLNHMEDGIYAVANAVALYYDSLSKAMSDINSGPTENITEDMAAATVKVCTAGPKLSVVLLADVSETAEIVVNKNIELILNGHVLSFTAADAHLTIAEGTDCTVDGTVPGSAIVKEGITATTKQVLAYVHGNLSIKGGTYKMDGSISALSNLFDVKATSGLFILDDCTVIFNNSNSGAIKAVQSLGKENRIKKSMLSTNGNGTVASVLTTNKTIIADTTMRNVSANGDGAGFSAYYDTSDVLISMCDISAVAGAKAIGIENQGTMTIENSVVHGDAPGDDADEESATGLMNTGGTICLNNTDVTGTLSGLQNSAGKVYVSGGTFKGYSHGGFYFSHGADGIAYIKDATIKCGDYDGVFTDVFAGDTAAILGGFYVGGGSTERSSNMTVYLDGCTIDGNGANAFVLRGTSGETNNTVNISNSTVIGSIRIDADKNHKLNVGIGTNITESKITAPEYATFTNELYRKHPEGAALTSGDYKALANAFAEIRKQLHFRKRLTVQRLICGWMLILRICIRKTISKHRPKRRKKRNRTHRQLGRRTGRDTNGQLGAKI